MKKMLVCLLLCVASFAQGADNSSVKRWDPKNNQWVDAFPPGNAVEINQIPVSALPPTIGQVLQFNGTAWVPTTPNTSAALGGDLSGTVSAAKVVSIQGFPVKQQTPLDGQALVFNGTAGQFEPRVVSANPTMGGDISGLASTASVIALRGVGISATTPQSGQMLQFNGSQWGPAAAPNGNPALGGDLNGVANAATVVKLQGVSVSTTAPGSGQYMVFNGTSWAPAPAPTYNPSFSGDVSGTPGAMSVVKLQGVSVANTAPGDKNLLVYNAINQRWQPTAQADDVRQISYSVYDPTADLTTASGTVSTVFTNRSNKSWQIQEVYCKADSGSPTFNLNINGSNVFGSAMNCASTGSIYNSNFAQGSVAPGYSVGHLLVGTATGNKQVSVTVTYKQ